MNLYIASIVAATVFSAACTYQIQDWRYGAKEADRDRQTYETTLESQRLAHRAQTEDDQRVIAAQNAATLLQRNLRANAATSRAALASVSYAAGEAMRRALESHDACLATATAASELLTSVSAERRELAEKADLHVIDIKTLVAAWPKCKAQ